MIGVLETCKCGTNFLRGIYPQSKCWMCEAKNPHVRPEQKIKPENRGGRMKKRILVLGLVCLFSVLGCEKLPTTPDITGKGFPAPYNLVATVISSSSIGLNWKNGTRYNAVEIHKNVGDMGHVLYHTTWGHNESWEDINCMPETQHCYRIRGIFVPGAPGDSGKTDYSDEVCEITYVN